MARIGGVDPAATSGGRSQMLKVYGDRESGNCYKVGLLLEHLGISYEWIDVDILAPENVPPARLPAHPT